MTLRDKNGKIWEYIPIKEAKEKGIGPKNAAGDVFRNSKEKPIGTLTVTGSDGKEQTTRIYPYKEKLSYAETVRGYIPRDRSDEDTDYVRVVRRSLLKILLPILIILLLIGGGIAWYLTREQGPELDEYAVAYEMPGAVNTDPTQLMMPYFDEVTVTAEDRAGQAALANPEGNESYFRYVLTLSDSGEELYRSGLIEPGKAVVEWEVNQDLEPGDYAAELAIQTCDLDDPDTETNGGNMIITLHVE